MPKPVDVKPLKSYRLWIRYSDGVEGIVDLAEYVGKGLFSLWEEERTFYELHIGEGGAIAWNETIEMCPDALYLKITNKQPEDLFPALKELALHAGN